MSLRDWIAKWFPGRKLAPEADLVLDPPRKRRTKGLKKSEDAQAKEVSTFAKTRNIKPLPPRRCDICDVEYVPGATNSHYCGDKCRREAEKVGIFVRPRRSRRQIELPLAPSAPSAPSAPVADVAAVAVAPAPAFKLRRRRCLECGKLYQPLQRRARFCSDHCSMRAYRRRMKEKKQGG